MPCALSVITFSCSAFVNLCFKVVETLTQKCKNNNLKKHLLTFTNIYPNICKHILLLAHVLYL